MGSKTGIGIATGIPFINKRKGGSGVQPLPPDLLDVLVGVWIADQNNNDSSNRDTIKNKIPNAGGDFELLNFAYKLNSGYGKYEVDFTTWYKQSGVSSEHNKFTIISNDISYNNNYIGWPLANLGDVPKLKIKISGIKDGVTVVYEYYKDNVNIVTSQIRMNKDGIYDLPYSYSIGGTHGFKVTDGKDPRIIGITIEQIPSFQGALVTDGVNDLITSSKTVQEMLGGSNEITVVSMIHQIELNSTHGIGFTNCIVATNSTTSFVRSQSNAAGKTGIYGYTYNSLTQLLINNILGDKNDYEKLLANSSNVLSDSEFYVASSKASTNTFSKVAWYWTFIAKRVLKTDEINQVIAYYNLDKYVKPDIYYDVKKQGLSNNTPDADWYLKDFSGNGRDMQLYNYGKTPESGINEEGGLQSDGITDYGKAENLPIYKDYTVVADREIVDGLINNADGGVATRGTRWATGAFCFDYMDGVYSFGATNGYVDRVKPNRFISYMSKYIHNGITTPVGDAVDNNPLCIAKLGSSIDRYSKLALWSFLLFPYSLSEFLLERQLKRYMLGTLYPDMVEFRPIITGNIPYKGIEIHQGSTILYSHLVNNTGTYISKDEPIRIFISANGADIVSSITVNGVTKTDLKLNANGKYWANFPITKSPQKISYVIDEYVRYEDIVQPYPAFINLKQDGKVITWGDKLKVGSEVTFVNHTNLLPDLYTISGGVSYNGVFISNWGSTIKVAKSMTFTNVHSYKKANEPNCIADPQRLRIPNSSYKILGYIPDISGHGNHLKINNSAYVGMSGANGYKYDWNTWRISKNGITSTITDNSLHITSLKEQYNPNQALFEPKTVADTGDKSNFKVNITGLTSSIKCTFNNAGAIIKELVNGVNEISVDLVAGWYGFMITALDGSIIGDCDITIQQIGEYEGSFCLDGVDDFITIPTLSHGAKQVLMKVNWQKADRISYDQRSSYNSTFAIYTSDESGITAYNTRNNGETYIDGVLNSAIMASQLKGITHNITITNSNVTNTNSTSPRIGVSISNTFYTKMALFSFMSFPEISSEEEIKELNDIVGIEGGYVESPDYYWDAYGKANRATQDIDYLDLNQAGNANQVLIDKSKAGLAALELYHNTGNTTQLNNRRLVANNFAFNKESGYNGWLGIMDLTTALNYKGDTTTNNWKRGGTFLKDRNRNYSAGCGYAFAEWFDKANYILKFKVKITGLIDTDELYICQYSIIDPEIKQQLFNGINEVILDLSASIEPTYQYISFRYPPLTNDVDFEFLYEYQNGLVSDGVDDHLINGIIPAFTDFTVIAKRISKADIDGTMFVIKGKDGTITNAAFGLEYKNVNSNYTYSFGASTKIESIPNLITWCTPTNYNGQVLTKGNVLDANGIQIGKFASRYWKGVFYKMMLYSKTIDQLSINMLKNLFERDELINVKHPIFKNENSTSQSTLNQFIY